MKRLLYGAAAVAALTSAVIHSDDLGALTVACFLGDVALVHFFVAWRRRKAEARR